MSITPSASSAPGKVFLAGGYLVLDKNYSALVFALSARVHAVSAAAGKENTITIRSPQFSGAEWSYNITLPSPGSDSGVTVTATEGAKNAFIETTIRYVISYLSIPSDSVLPGAEITIYADNDYYSQPSPDVPRFNALNVPITSAHKTGLGSSAALTTALTACLLSTFSPIAASETTIHNLAQAAHCTAQGKVGSGFDVAAAVFGSCVYHRFSPPILEAVGDAGSAGFATRLRECVDSTWDFTIEKTSVPPGLRLLMGDVDCGSSTPGMVRKVLTWRKENAEEAKALWDGLEDLNKGLRDLLADARKRAEIEPEDVTLLLNIKSQLEKIRVGIRAMGEAAGVPIEPPAQTKLLDAATKATKGVLGGVVPGAGGYDAVVFLMADREKTVESLRRFLNKYQFEGEGEGKGTVEVLGTREEHEGVRQEDVGSYGV
ncbi:ribosomal protein S5 domain 2-type protein [Sphaerosporella brunnea]|uniref:Phosphomevalonate kinase n=1 Tax=Sphaerosporella brunnea TaxID=1250544 RepID=A0A5J5EW91_9PEZI|nr:ribosomal protein S5 domain 2-type protein [Sphaerosporella brunnea]